MTVVTGTLAMRTIDGFINLSMPSVACLLKREAWTSSLCLFNRERAPEGTSLREKAHFSLSVFLQLVRKRSA